MNSKQLSDALRLVQCSPRKSEDAQAWWDAASAMTKHCQGLEDVTEAAARIIDESRIEILDMLQRCEMWLSTIPEGRQMQLECQRIISPAMDDDCRCFGRLESDLDGDICGLCGKSRLPNDDVEARRE